MAQHNKKIEYKYPIQFFPRSSNDLLKDDPEESKNIVVPLEPEHFNYGVYFNDGYDYMKHFVSREDFLDESKDLKELAHNVKRTMLPAPTTKSATVIKEFEINDESCMDALNALEKLKTIAKNEIDDDILNALDSDAEFEEDLEDDFIELADHDVNPAPVKCDADIFKSFFGHDMVDDEKAANDSFDNNFVANIRKPIDEISKAFENEYKYMTERLKMPKEESKSTTLSICYLNALERFNAKEEKLKNLANVIGEPLEYNNLMYKGETEYDEKDIEKACSEWSYRKPKPVLNAFDLRGKRSKNIPKLMNIEKVKKAKLTTMEVEDDDETSEYKEEEETMTFTDVSQFHVPRPVNETAEEKRERKKAIKTAKRSRTEEKKVMKEAFKNARFR